VCECSWMSPQVVRGELYVLPASSFRSQRGGESMRCQQMDDDTRCRIDAVRRVLIVGGDPPDPDQSGFAGPLPGPGLQGARPRPPAVDAAAAASRFRADRRPSKALMPEPGG
jgi:hypothetical protein